MATREEKYQQYLQENVSALERAGDKLSGADERITYAIKQLWELMGLKDSIGNLNVLLGELRKVGFIMPTQTQQINFRETVAPLTGISVRDYIPLDGMITSISLHFPLGCNALVDIAVGHKTTQILPMGGFIALNDATPVYPVTVVCKRGEAVWCIIQNTDALQHTVSIALTVEGD